MGSNWTDDELDLIVADYFAMLALDAAGQPFVKAHRARALMDQTGRSPRSVEFKHMNISAVAAELGLPHVRGYRPMANYQAAIFDAIDRHLAAHPEVLSDDAFTSTSPPRSPLGEWGGGAALLQRRDGGGEATLTAGFRRRRYPVAPSVSSPSGSPPPPHRCATGRTGR